MASRKWWARIALIALCAAVVAYFAWESYWRWRGAQKLRLLLKGSPDVTIRRIDIEGQMKEASCSDAESVAFLTAAFRRAEPSVRWGKTDVYNARIHFAGGGYIKVVISPYRSADALELNVLWSQFDAEYDRYDLPFPERPPAKLLGVLKYLLGAEYEGPGAKSPGEKAKPPSRTYL